MVPAVVIALAASAEPRVVDLSEDLERVPAAVTVVRGEGFDGAASSSELFGVASETLERTTILRAEEIREVSVPDCEASLSDNDAACQVLASHQRGDEVFLRIVGYREDGQSFLSVDALPVGATADAMTARLAGRRDQEEAWLDAQVAVLEAWRSAASRAVRSRRDVIDAVRAAVDALPADLVRPLRAVTAELSVDVTPPRARLELGGTDLGRAGAAGLSVVGLSPGPYALRAAADGYRPLERRLVLDPGQRLDLELGLREDFRPYWWGMSAAGVLLLGGGAAALAYGLDAEESRVQPPYTDGGLLRWDSPAPEPGGVRVGERSPGSGPLIAGVAAGLAASGGILALWGWLGQDAEHAPWLEVVAGLAAGLATYGAFELAELE